MAGGLKRTEAAQALRRVGQFTSDAELQRALAEFEDNAHKALGAVGEAKAEKHQATPVHRAGEVRANFGELFKYDASTGAGTVLLPAGKPSDHGKTVTLKNVSTSATGWTIRPATGQLVDGAATQSAAGSLLATRLYFDGAAWWRL